MIKAAVLGATGFTGERIVEVLLGHPEVEITYLTSRTESPVPYAKMFPKFAQRINVDCQSLDLDEAISKADIFFLSLPHTVSMEHAPKILAQNKKVIDLSADYRFKDTATYELYYKTAHKDTKHLAHAVYGLPELYKNEIATASLIANPGCYPTSIILALFPLCKENLIEGKVVADSQSSITGAGRKASLDYHYSNIADNIWAYKPFLHQHSPEITNVLNKESNSTIQLCFIPHVTGVQAGIYSTIHVTLKKKIDYSAVCEIYRHYYRDCPFVRRLEQLPKLKDTVGSNFCDLGFAVDAAQENLLIASSIDNLMKGAAGQAVQNMNILFGLDETLGLL